MPTPIRLLLVTDDLSVRRAMRMRLDLDNEIDVAGEASDGTVALAMAESHAPDVVLLDLSLPGMSGLETCSSLAERGFRVVTFSLDDGTLMQKRAMAAGAAACVSKRATANELLAALHAVGSQRGPNKGRT